MLLKQSFVVVCLCQPTPWQVVVVVVLTPVRCCVFVWAVSDIANRLTENIPTSLCQYMQNINPNIPKMIYFTFSHSYCFVRMCVSVQRLGNGRQWRTKGFTLECTRFDEVAAG